MEKGLDIKQKVEGKNVTLSLTEKEVDSAISACKTNGVESVIIMKKHNGGALFFIEERRAYACQERHRFDYAFSVKLKDLEEHKAKVNKANKDNK